MACELLQREFKADSDGRDVLIGTRQLSADKALDLHVELVQKLGDAIFPFIQNKYNFSDILYLMRQGGTHTEVTELFKRVVCMATIDGQEVSPRTLQLRYNGELMLMQHVFAFVLEANFLDFFKQGLEINERRRLEAEEASKLAEQKNSSPEKI